MNDYKIDLIKQFSGKCSENFDENWDEIMYISEIIHNISFYNLPITQHEYKLLRDLRQYLRDSISVFDKVKVTNCIIDFISTYNIIFNGIQSFNTSREVHAHI